MKLIKWSAIGLAVFTVILTIVFFTWWAFKDEAVFGGEKFDQVRWVGLADSVQTDCRRGDMAYDLKNHILIRGAQKEAVMALLGRPSLEDAGALEYDLGKCMHVYHVLRIYFDQTGRLTHSQISSH